LALCAGALIHSLVASLASGLATAQQLQEPGIVVVGTALAEVVPDRAFVTLDLAVTADKARTALEEFATARAKLVADLATIEGGDVKVGVARPRLGTNLDMQTIMMGNGQVNDPEIQATESIEVSIRVAADGDLLALVTQVVDVGRTHDATIGNPAETMSLLFMNGMQSTSGSGAPAPSIRYELSDAAAAQQAALAVAIADARAQAQTIANIAGVKLGPLAAVAAADAQLPRWFEQAKPAPQRLQVRLRFAIAQ